MSGKLPLVVIAGPTAVGKTDVGILVARRINGEVISGDSMQVYRHMDIGTAKPTIEEMGGIPHHMIDILNPDEEFNVALFQKKVEYLIIEINKRGKTPILVGGTGLYINSVINYYDFSPPGGDLVRREELSRLAVQRGNEYLMGLLREADPAAASKIHLNDTRRLVRALEVYYLTGRPISGFQYNSEGMPPKYNLSYFGLLMNREKLYQRIEQRVDKMIAKGLVEEVQNLIEMGYKPSNTAMQALGYKEIIDYLYGRCTLEEAVLLIKRNTRRLAKRQMTWFRRDKRIKWIDVEKYDSLQEIADKITAEVGGQFNKA